MISVNFARDIIHMRTIELRFPPYWPFVRGIHWWQEDSPHKGRVTRKQLLSYTRVSSHVVITDNSVFDLTIIWSDDTAAFEDGHLNQCNTLLHGKLINIKYTRLASQITSNKAWRCCLRASLLPTIPASAHHQCFPYKHNGRSLLDRNQCDTGGIDPISGRCWPGLGMFLGMPLCHSLAVAARRRESGRSRRWWTRNGRVPSCGAATEAQYALREPNGKFRALQNPLLGFRALQKPLSGRDNDLRWATDGMWSRQMDGRRRFTCHLWGFVRDSDTPRGECGTVPWWWS